MASLGEILAKEREAKGISIDEVSRVTKIQPKFIIALEQEDFEIFPATVYLKSFLCSYAQYLGLEPKELLSAYEETGAGPELIKKNFYPKRKYPPQGRRSSQGHRTLALFVILLIGIAVLSYSYYNNIRQLIGQSYRPTEKIARTSDTKMSDKPQEESLTTTPPQTVQEATPIMEDKSSPSTAPLLQGTQEPIITTEEVPAPATGLSVKQYPEVLGQTIGTPVPHPEVFIPEELGEKGKIASDVTKEPKATSQSTLVLTIDAIEDTWLRVSADGETQPDLLLRGGKSKEWKAQEKFVLIIGHVAGARLRLNGKEIPLPYTKNDVLRDFVLTRKNIP